jgi:Xaa-Pro aminopeptidase
MAELGADFALLISPDAVCYATGMAVPIDGGPSPFAGGPPVAIVARSGSTAVVVSDREESAARAGDPDVEIRVYEGYAWDRPLRPVDAYREAVAGLAADIALGGRVATEPSQVPGAIRATIAFHHARPLDIGPVLGRVRSTKTPWEVERLRRATELTALGHRAVRETASVGRTELEVFDAARSTWEAAVGERQPAVGDLLSGVARTAAVLGGPTDRRISAGDPVIADLVPRIHGYWGDTCSTLAVVRPTTRFRVLWTVVADALARGAELLRPGIRAGELDAAVRDVITRAGYRYAHHTGHGIGTAVHEQPRIVPGESTVIAEGMVICLEPGAYDSDVGGARLELTFLVTTDGAEPLVPIPEILDRGIHT